MTVIPAQSQPARQAHRWLISALAVSLLLNGLVIGMMASRWLNVSTAMPWLGSSDNAHLFGLAVTLSPERHREIRSLVEAERTAMRPLRKVRLEAREDVRKALLADPFDTARFVAAQKRLFDTDIQTRLGTLKIVEATVQRLTVEERAALAEWENQDRANRREFWRRMREGDKK